MIVRALNCFEGDEGVYYNPRTDFMFILSNKTFQILRVSRGVFADVGSGSTFDIESEDGIETTVVLPKLKNMVYLGEL